MEVESAGVSESVIPTVGFSTLAQGTRHSDSDRREMGWKAMVILVSIVEHTDRFYNQIAKL